MTTPNVKVAQPGWNANTAPDWALVFSSDWPSLQIAFEQTFTIAAGDIIDVIATHNLGFPPLAMAWITTNGSNYGRVSQLEVDNKYVFYANLDAILSTDVILTVRCYAIDISKEASYPLPASAAAKTAPDLSTGVKIVKQRPPRNIHSPNLNDFILNSQAQSPAVLEVATQSGQYFSTTATTSKLAIVYPLQTPYIPWVVGAVTFGTYNPPATYQYYSPNALTYDASSNSLVLDFGAIGNGASLIILRDPLFYPNVVRVVY